MASVDFDHVDKEYAGGGVAVRDLSLHVDDGELMVVVGPSGCGKSTVLRLLAGLEDATRGTIRIAGEVVNDRTPQERNIAMVFQDYALYPHRTVRGNLEFPLRMRRLPKAEIARRTEWAAGLLGLSAKLDRLPKQLSGGERQRVAMGRALVREPTVFLLDEPLSNLDAKLRGEMRAEIADIQRRTATTMLYVTHDQVEAMTLGHRVTVLDKGRVQQIAAPRELYQHPVNVFVAGFIGNPPMNLFPTTVTADERGGLRATIGDQTIALAANERLRSLVGRRLTGGLRAESLHVATDGDEGIAAVVEHSEALGHEILAAIRVRDGANGARLIVRVPADRDLESGATLRLAIAEGALHLFDEDGRAVAS